MDTSAPSSSPVLGLFPGRASPRLYDEVVRVLRAKHYSVRTIEAYLGWIGRFVRFHDGRHPRDFGVQEVNEFVSHLATRGRVAASTQNQALAAVLFLYKEVFGQPLGRVEGIVRARKPKRLPIVMTRAEAASILSTLLGTPRLVCMLQYGSGLRLLEALQLRVKDLDFGRGELLVRDPKGKRDRVTMLPAALHEPLSEHLSFVFELGRALLQEQSELCVITTTQGSGVSTLTRVVPSTTLTSDCQRTSQRASGDGPTVTSYSHR